MSDADLNVVYPPAVKRSIAAGKAAFDAQSVQPPTPMATNPANPQPQVIMTRDGAVTVPPLSPMLPTNPTPPPVASGEPQPTHPTPPAIAPEPPQSDNSLAEMQAQIARTEAAMRTLQGRHRVELERLTAELREARAQVTAATTQMAELVSTVAANNGGRRKDLTTPRNLASVTPQERTDYGDAFMDMLSRAAADIATQIVEERTAPLIAQNTRIGAQLDTTVRQAAMSKKERRDAWLDINCPGWRSIDEDPGFDAWLDQDDMASGMPRKEIVARAHHRDDYPRIKAIFDGYAKELGAIAPSQTPREIVQPRARLEALAAPNGGNGRVDAIVPSDAPEAPLSAIEVQQYFDRKVRKPGSLTAAEIEKFEARLARAMQSGNFIGVPPAG